MTGCGLATLARLQQHAFLQYASESGRYQIHEVLRQYGAAQLDADPARKADAQRSHSRHYCAWLAGQGGRINTAEQMRVLAAIDAEVENCRAAWEWAAAAGDSAVAGICRGRAVLLLRVSRTFPGGGRRLPDRHGTRSARGDGRGRAAAGASVGLAGRVRPFPGPVLRRLERLLQSSLARLEELAGQGLEVSPELAFTRLRMGEAAEWRNSAEAQAHLDASQRLYRSMGDSWGAARALEGLGLATLVGLETVAAEDHYRQAIALLGTTGDPRLRARLRYRLAYGPGVSGSQG